MRKIRQIANHLDFRVPGNRKVVVHNDAADPVSRHAERFANERRDYSRPPKFSRGKE